MNALEPYRGPSKARDIVLSVDPPRANDGDRLDLRFLVAALRRRLGLLLGIMVTIVVLTALFLSRQPYVYSATASVVLNMREARIAPGTAEADAELPNAERADTEVEVLKSRALAESVAAALDLDHDPAFAPAPRKEPGGFARVGSALGFGRPKAGAAAMSQADIHRAVVDKLQAGLKADRSDQTFALGITYVASTATDAARIANEYARQYTEGQLRAKIGQNQSATGFLSSRLSSLQAQAQSDAERVQQYRIEHNLLSTSGSSLTEQEISSYNQAVTTARAQAAEDLARLNTARAQLRGGSNGGDAGEALNSPVVGGLRAREAEVSGRLAALTSRYGPQYPDVAKTRSELTDIQTQIKDEVARVISNLDARVMVSSQRLASLTGSLSTARNGLADSNRAMAGLNDLDRRAKASQALYESYLNRYKETVAQEGTEHADARLLSSAEPPLLPSSPRVLLGLIIAAVLGAGLGIAAAIITELQFTGLTTSDDVERRLGLAHLGNIPQPSSMLPKGSVATDAVVDERQSGFAEVFRGLRETLRQAAGEIPRVIAFTSALPNEGIALASVCFARTLALSGDNTILIDCNLREAAVAEALHVSRRRPDLLDVVQGKASLDEAIVIDEATGLALLLADVSGDRASHLIFGTRLQDMIAELRLRFDYVVVATAPLLPVAETRSIAPLADATILLVRWRSTADHVVRAAMRLLSIRVLKVTGVMLTGVDMKKQAKFGSSDPSSYYQRYEAYYR